MPRLIAMVCIAALGVTSTARGQFIDPRMKQWGVETYNEIDRTLRLRNSGSSPQLFAESAALSGTQTGGFNGRAYVWPASTQFRVFTGMMMHDKAAYQTITRQFSDQLIARYWDTSGYRAGAGPANNVPSTVNRFYDDNAHIVIALAEAYNLTKDPVYLNRAIATQAFVMSGEVQSYRTAAGVLRENVWGIKFEQTANDKSVNVISSLQGARGAAMLYRATGQASYLTDAKRLLFWAQNNMQQSNGLFAQGYDLETGTRSGVDLVNSAGTGVSAFIEVYKATGDAAYLTEARRIANASVGRWTNSAGVMGDEGMWAFELIDAWNALAQIENKSTWQGRINKALTYLHDNMKDTNGHYGLFWGRNGPISSTTLNSWNLNDMAPVARAYLISAPEPATLASVVALGTLAAVRRRRA